MILPLATCKVTPLASFLNLHPIVTIYHGRRKQVKNIGCYGNSVKFFNFIDKSKIFSKIN